MSEREGGVGRFSLYTPGFHFLIKNKLKTQNLGMFNLTCFLTVKLIQTGKNREKSRVRSESPSGPFIL